MFPSIAVALGVTYLADRFINQAVNGIKTISAQHSSNSGKN